MNLTSLPVGDASDLAIDRLLAEPIVASRLIRSEDQIAVDLGSGGGSPAFPLKIGAPGLRMVLVESKERKCAFLREVARSLGMADIDVVTSRFESLVSRPDLAGRVHVVSFRAVRADSALWDATRSFLMPGGRAFWFGGPADASLPAGFAEESSHVLIPPGPERPASHLTVLSKSER